MSESGYGLRGMRVLVTGSTGFIGSKLVRRLLDHEAKVTVVVDSEPEVARLEPLLADSRLHLVPCSVADADDIAAQKERWGDIDLLVHLRLQVPQTKTFCEQASEDITMNLLPTLNLLRALDDSVRGICFASSVAVYGCPSRLPVREDDLPQPISSYGVTKLAIENYLRAYGRARQVPVTVLRYATVYGPGETGHRAIPNFVHSLAEGQPPLIYGDGCETRDYVYVDDVVEATIQALIRRPDQVLNIGSGRGYTSLWIARELIRLWPAKVEPRFLPRVGENVDMTCDILAAKKTLGYFPQVTLEEGLRREIEWYRREVLTVASRKGE